MLEDESGAVSKPKEARVQSSAVHQVQKDGTHKKPVFSKVKDNRVDHFRGFGGSLNTGKLFVLTAAKRDTFPKRAENRRVKISRAVMSGNERGSLASSGQSHSVGKSEYLALHDTSLIKSTTLL
jgi:hypothetical protein